MKFVGLTTTVSLVAIALVSCGGSGSSDTAKAEIASAVVPVGLNTDIITINGINYPVISSLELDGSLLEVSEEGKLIIDGVEIPNSIVGATGDTEEGYPVGAIYTAFAVSDEDGDTIVAISDYFTAEDFVEAQDAIGLAFTLESQDPDWTWSGVEYGYILVNGVDEMELVQNNDGSIVFNGETWEAQLGDVELVGAIEGFEVSGTATLDNMRGNFEGIDGIYMIDNGDTELGYYTTGAFAGDDGGAAGFAGGWYNQDFN